MFRGMQALAPLTCRGIIGKLMEFIGVSRVRTPVDCANLEIIDIPLGILGILGGEGAAAVGRSRNQWKTIGIHWYFAAGDSLESREPRNHWESIRNTWYSGGGVHRPRGWITKSLENNWDSLVFRGWRFPGIPRASKSLEKH